VRLEGEEVTFTWKTVKKEQRVREITLSGQEFLRRILLHVLPDRFVRIRYYGLLTNRHREQALILCREVLPGPPGRPKLTKLGLAISAPESHPGIAPMRHEVWGQNALRLAGKLAPAKVPRAPFDSLVAHGAISIFIYPAGERGPCVSCRSLRYNRLHEIAVRKLGMRQIPFAGRSPESLSVALGVVWRPAEVAREGACEGLNLRRTVPDSPAASFNLRL
jgi:hypothetical protein